MDKTLEDIDEMDLDQLRLYCKGLYSQLASQLASQNKAATQLLDTFRTHNSESKDNPKLPPKEVVAQLAAQQAALAVISTSKTSLEGRLKSVEEGRASALDRMKRDRINEKWAMQNVIKPMDERISTLKSEIDREKKAFELLQHQYQDMTLTAMAAVSKDITSSADQYERAFLEYTSQDEDEHQLKLLHSLLSSRTIQDEDRAGLVQRLSEGAQEFAFGKDNSVSALDKRFVFGMLYDALPTEKRLRDLMITCMAPHGDVLVIPGPIKGVPRIDQKTAEKYGGRFDQVKDVTRITIDCPSIAVMYTVVEVLLDEDALEIVLLDFKDRLDRMKCNPADSGGYLDLLFNFCFKGSAHIFEVQVTLRRFLEIKNAIGHRAYHVARRLNAYSKFVREYHGALTPEALHGIKSGLFTSASFDGTRLDPAYITEFSEAISSDTCRLVTLSARVCDLSGQN